MNIEARLLQITINTNIPGKSVITFNSDLLHHPDYKKVGVTSRYPYITNSVYLPMTKLKALEHDKLVEFFFDENNFITTLSSLSDNLSQTKSDDANKILKTNVMSMLELLFSTKYFVVNNVHLSMDLLLKTNPNKSIFYNPSKTNFSYLKIDNKPYTVTKVVWLNDIVNHPRYRDLLTEIHNVVVSIKDDARNELKLIEKGVDNIVSLFNQLFSSIAAVKDISFTKNSAISMIVCKFIINFLTNTHVTGFDRLYELTENDINATSDVATKMAALGIGYRNDLEKIKRDVLQPLIDNMETDTDIYRYQSLYTWLNNTNAGMLDMLIGTKEYKEQTKLASRENIINTVINKSRENIVRINKYIKLTTFDFQLNPFTDRKVNSSLTFFINNVYPLFTSFRKSSNAVLQQHIEGSSIDDTKMLFNSLDKIYNRFISKNKQITIDKALVDIGVDRINFERGKMSPKNEIYIMLDLIEGEVNETNKKEVYCSYTDQYLGNMLDDLMKKDTDVVVKNKALYSIDNKVNVSDRSSKYSKSSKENAGNPLPNSNLDETNVVSKPMSEISELFTSKIIDQQSEELATLIQSISTSTKQYIQTNQLLQHIKDSYSQVFGSDKRLNVYNLISTWASKTTYNDPLFLELKRMEGTIDTEISIITKRLSSATIKPDQKRELINKRHYLNMYLYIIRKLIENETAKPNNAMADNAENRGGTIIKHKNRTASKKIKRKGHVTTRRNNRISQKNR